MSFQSLGRSVRQFSNHWRRRILLALLFIAPAIAPAQTNSDKYVLGPTNVLGEELYAFVTAADIAGTIADDAVVFAATDAKLSGTISNDLWMAAAKSIDISGRVGDRARIAAISVEISGTFARSLAAAGQSINLATNSTVCEDAYLAGYRVSLEGIIGSNAHIQAGSATIGGHIRGNVFVTAADIAVLPNTKIDGDLVYTTQNELFLDKSVMLGGKLKHQKPPAVSVGEMLAIQISGTFMMALAAFFTGVPFLLLLPRTAGNCVRLLRHSPWRCMYVGAFAFIIAVVMALIATPTIIGVPMSLTLLAGLSVAAYLGNVLVALAIGGTLMRQHGPQPFLTVIMTLVLGLVILYMLKALPYVGTMLGLFGWFAGSGSLILNMLHGQRIVQPQEPPPLPDPAQAGNGPQTS